MQISALFILCYKVSQVGFPNKCVLQCLNIAFIIANIADPYEMQQNHQTNLSGVSSLQRVYSPLSDKFNRVMPLGLKPLGLEP